MVKLFEELNDRIEKENWFLKFFEILESLKKNSNFFSVRF